MGLDMYLDCDIYIGGQYEHRRVSGELAMSMLAKPNSERPTEIVIPAKELSSVTIHVGYWRKVNAVHGWFVENVQGGRDECQRSDVQKEHLETLRALCAEALDKHDPTILPGVDGFFFGSTAADEWYWDGIKHTIEVCDKALELYDEFEDFMPTFHYQASW